MGAFQHIQRKDEPVTSTYIQPQLEIGNEDDEHEREANHLADKVMRMSEPEDEKKKMHTGTAAIQRMSTGEQKGMVAPPKVEQGIYSSKGRGQNLQAETQQEMGSKIGADFSDVNVHTDGKAVQMSKDIGANAFTHGNDIYFNKGQYNPSSNEGKHLLAHELTHTVQQSEKVNTKIQKQNGDGKLSQAGKELTKVGATAEAELQAKGDIYIKGADLIVKQYGDKGSFDWGIKWQTNAKNGWIIQKIQNTYNLTDCTGKKLAVYDHPIMRTYWEAWEVKDGVVLDGGRDRWAQGEIGQEILDKPIDEGYKGFCSIDGTVYFSPTIDKKIWKRREDLGGLYARFTDPSITSPVKMTRRAAGTLSTCGATSTWYHKPAK